MENEKEEHIWRRKIFGSWRRRKRENEKDKNIGRRNTFGQSRRRRTEKEKEEDIWEKESDGGQILSFYNTNMSQHLTVGISRHPVDRKNNRWMKKEV